MARFPVRDIVWQFPYDEGLRDPGKFIVNQQTWLSLWHDWHLMVGSESAMDELAPITPPLILNDFSLTLP